MLEFDFEDKPINKIKRLYYKTIGRVPKKIIIGFLFLVVFDLLIFIITLPPTSDRKNFTAKEATLRQNIRTQSGALAPNLLIALDLLKEYPRFYNQIINNVATVFYQPYPCSPYAQAAACVQGYAGATAVYFNTATIEPQYNPRMLAEIMVHETEHLEYLHSGPLRRWTLLLKCSIPLNPQITFQLSSMDLLHRVSSKEICSEREATQASAELTGQASFIKYDSITLQALGVVYYYIKFVGSFFVNAFLTLRSLFY
jgi:hypothetical protein